MRMAPVDRRDLLLESRGRREIHDRRLPAHDDGERPLRRALRRPVRRVRGLFAVPEEGAEVSVLAPPGRHQERLADRAGRRTP